MIAQHHAVHAKTTQGSGQATSTGDHVGLHGLEEVLKDPVRLAHLQATRPPSPWANQSEVDHDVDVASDKREKQPLKEADYLYHVSEEQIHELPADLRRRLKAGDSQVVLH